MKLVKHCLVLAFGLGAGLLTAQAQLPKGIWHAQLTHKTGQHIPFNFEVSDTAGQTRLAIINGAERFKVTDVKTIGDSVFIHMPLFDSEFRARLSGNTLTGFWLRHLPQGDQKIAFTAQANTAWRIIPKPLPAKYEITGRYSAIFASGDTTVAEFKQQGNNLTGTFLTTTGDYRFLQGTVSADSLYLSCFDGGHAFLFTAKINSAQSISGGQFYAGLSGQDSWTATLNPKAALPDAYSLTRLKPSEKSVSFTFTDLSGNKVTFPSERFKGKVLILQIMGSWCPNCMDETAYMVPFYNKYHNQGVEVLGLAYERVADFTHAQKSVSQIKNRFNVPYPLLLTGYTNGRGQIVQSLPALANFMGFPTTIIIDKKGLVRKIHTGFSGPGTGTYYEEFETEFESLIKGLLTE